MRLSPGVSEATAPGRYGVKTPSCRRDLPSAASVTAARPQMQSRPRCPPRSSRSTCCSSAAHGARRDDRRRRSTSRRRPAGARRSCSVARDRSPRCSATGCCCAGASSRSTQLIATMEQVDLADAARTRRCPRAMRTARRSPARRGLRRMLDRLEAERARGRARGDPAPRSTSGARIAQDLHDEVNQALTGVSLRLQAIDRGRAAGAARASCARPAAGQPGDGGAAGARARAAAGRARRPRPRSRRCDTPGRGLRRPDRDPGRPSDPPAALPTLDPRAAARDLPGRPGEPLEHRAARRGARTSASSCRSSARTVAADQRRRPRLRAGASRRAASGSPGCASAPLLAGGSSRSGRDPGRGTRVELTYRHASGRAS